MPLTLITPPASEPLDVSEAKLYARISQADEDVLVEDLIRAARELVEGRGIAIHTQTWEYALDRFPVCFRLPIAPLQSVTSITYTDSDGVATVLAADQYTVDTRSRPARIVPAYGVSWPATRTVPNAVVVKFVAGFDPANPEQIRSYERVRQYMRFMVARMYERQGSDGTNPTEILATNDFLDHLLDDLVVYM